MFNIIEPLPPVTVSVKDLMTLDQLIASLDAQQKDQNPIAEYLGRELNRAHVVAEKDIPPHIVKMHSTVTYAHEVHGEERKLTLVYPHEANIEAGKVSILTPIGAALIGISAGDSITYYTPNGGAQNLTVIAVSDQPL